jgi:hypothetical protein
VLYYHDLLSGPVTYYEAGAKIIAANCNLVNVESGECETLGK